MVTGLTGDGLAALTFGLFITTIFAYTNTALFECLVFYDYDSILSRIIVFCGSFALGLAISITAAFVCS